MCSRKGLVLISKIRTGANVMALPTLGVALHSHDPNFRAQYAINRVQGSHGYHQDASGQV
jgi:hypothetical protein